MFLGFWQHLRLEQVNRHEKHCIDPPVTMENLYTRSFTDMEESNNILYWRSKWFINGQARCL